MWVGGAHGGDGVEAVGDGVDDLRMRRVDFRVDHRDQDLLAGGEAMRFAKMQLGRRVLRARIELGPCGWYLRERRHRRLRKREAIIGLGVAHQAVDLKGANDVGDVGAVGDPPAIIRRADQGDVVALDHREPMALRERVEFTRRDVRGEPDDDLVRHELALADRRDPAARNVLASAVAAKRVGIERRVRRAGYRIADAAHQRVGDRVERRRRSTVEVTVPVTLLAALLAVPVTLLVVPLTV